MTAKILPFTRPMRGAPEVQLPERPTPKRGSVHAIQSAPDAVTVFIGPTELWLSPAQAEELASDLLRFAKSARALSNQDPKAE